MLLAPISWKCMANDVLLSRESYGLEHVRRVLRYEARRPYRAPHNREKCAKVHGPGCRACRTCHFCRHACLSFWPSTTASAGTTALPFTLA